MVSASLSLLFRGLASIHSFIIITRFESKYKSNLVLPEISQNILAKKLDNRSFEGADNT
jgi:hypothetical protein